MKHNLNIEDEQLLFDLLRQGDETAFEKIYNHYWPDLYSAAYKRFPEKERCQDIIQNVFADLWKRRGEVNLANPKAYLHTAVRFQVLKQVARAPRNTFFSQKFEEQLISPLTTDSGVLEKEREVLIEYFILALPKKRREIFLLHYHEGLSTAKIALRLNVSRKTVQNQLTTVSHALRLKLTHLFFYLAALHMVF